MSYKPFGVNENNESAVVVAGGMERGVKRVWIMRSNAWKRNKNGRGRAAEK